MAKRKKQDDQETVEFKLEDYLFDKQLAFVKDPSPLKTAVCSRRSGKSIACAADLVDAALNTPECLSLYLTITSKRAKAILWPELRKINRLFKLGASENATELTLHFPNESIIALVGANTADQIDKYRGTALKKAYIDEAQSFRSHIRELCDDVLEPQLMDYAGDLILIGTPGPLRSGYFYECSVKNDLWSHHAWTFFDNPHIPIKSRKTHMELLDRVLKRRKVDINDPGIRREYFGEWTDDPKALLLHYSERLNHALLTGTDDNLNHIIGIRLSMDNDTCIVVLAWSATSPNTFLVEECTPKNQTLDGLDGEIRRCLAKYKVSCITVDPGDTGRDIVDAISLRYGISLSLVEPKERISNFVLLDNSLQNGTFKADKSSQFAEDCMLIERDAEKSTPGKLEINGHSNIVDAVLSAFRKSPAFAYMEPIKEPDPFFVDWEYQHRKFVEGIGTKEMIEWNTDQKGIAPWNQWDKN
jgi:hypothetical protein